MSLIQPPSALAVKKALSEFKIAADDNQIEQIREYMKLLLTWNQKVNLTAIRDPQDILYRHFCESMMAAQVVDMSRSRLADIGTGGGFPGLALKILLPEAQVILVESSVKKATFLAEVVRALGLANVQVLVSRYEELGEEIAPVDFACARALGEFAAFLDWARSAKVDAKQLLLWLGERDVAEVQRVGGWSWKAAVPVPQSLRRVILVGEKA